jgi:acetylornithine deacetylase
MADITTLQQQALTLLQQLISIPSFSKEEDRTADLIEQLLQQHGVKTHRKLCSTRTMIP